MSRPATWTSLRGYRRAWLTADLLAALTLLAIAVPEQLATARLAGMPPITGYYAFVVGTVVFAALGSSPQLSVGADSTIAPLFAVGVARVAASGTPRYVDVVGLLGLHAHGVAVLGHVAGGLPRLGLRGASWHLLRTELPIATVVALVVVSQSAATTRAFADLGRYDVNVGRDFVGVGAGSVVAGLVGAFPVDASPPRTALVASSSGRTQLAGLVAALALLALVPAAGLLADVPLATLAAVLVFVASRIFRARDLLAIAHFDRFELALVLVTMLAVALVGVEQGIAVAVALAILDRTRLSARPQMHVLGRIPGTTSWVPLASERDVEQVPEVLAVLFATPLWYANAVHFRAQLSRAVGPAPGSARLVVLDTIGMSDLDYTGARALADALADLERDHVVFAMARAGAHVHESLRRSGLLDRIGEGHLFSSVDEAVTALAP